MSLSWQDATRPGIRYEGMMPGRSDITDGESTSLNEAGFSIGKLRETLEQTAALVQNHGAVLLDYGDEIKQKAESWAVPTIAPLSQTINRRADANFQLSDFMAPMVRGRSDQAGHNHQHDTTSAPALLAEGWTTPGRTYVTFITPAITRAYEEINFMVGAAPATPATLDLAIFVVDENRGLTRQLGNLRVSDQIGPARQVVSIEFDRWVATQGSYIGVAMRQGATGTPRPLLGLLEPSDRPLTNKVFPRAISAVKVTGGDIPATIDGTTDLNFEADWFNPYVELSEAIGTELRAFTEGWGHKAIAPSPWVSLTDPGLYSGAANSSAPTNWAGANGFGTRVSMFSTPLSTDRGRIRTTIAYVSGQSGDNTRRSTLIIRGSNNLRSGVGLAVSRDSGYALIEWSNTATDADWHSRATLASVQVPPRVGDEIEIDYLDGLVTVRINGQARITDHPVGGPQGAAGRFVGIQAERTGSLIVAYPSPWFGSWTARDLPPVVDGGGTGTEG